MENQKRNVYELIKDKIVLDELFIKSSYSIEDVHSQNELFVNSVVNYIESSPKPIAMNTKHTEKNQIHGYAIFASGKVGLIIRSNYNLKETAIFFPDRLTYAVSQYGVYLQHPYEIRWFDLHTYKTSLELEAFRFEDVRDNNSRIIYYKALNDVANNNVYCKLKTYDILTIDSNIYNDIFKELVELEVFNDWFKIQDNIVKMTLLKIDDVYSYKNSLTRLTKFIKQYYKIKYDNKEIRKNAINTVITYLKGVIKNSIPLKETIKVSDCEIDISTISAVGIEDRIVSQMPEYITRLSVLSKVLGIPKDQFSTVDTINTDTIVNENDKKFILFRDDQAELYIILKEEELPFNSIDLLDDEENANKLDIDNHLDLIEKKYEYFIYKYK